MEKKINLITNKRDETDYVKIFVYTCSVIIYYYNNIVKLSFTYIVSPVVIEFTEVMVQCAEEL